MRKFSWITLLVVAVAGTVQAQEASIDPGMNREQVVARLGKPISEHTAGSRTYLYYSNGDEKKYGMHDFVTLEDGKVTDAVFRSSAHKFTGKSSSPAPVPVDAAIAKGHGGHLPAKPPVVEKKAPPPAEKKALPPVEKKAPPVEKKASPPAKKAEPPAKATTPAPTKKAEAQPKAVPPATKNHEPLKSPDTKKIAPAPKPADTTKKATPAPAKKP